MARPATVQQALARGYCITSRASCGATRIDRKDWREVMAEGHPGGMDWVKRLGPSSAASHYRRCHSRDGITVPKSWLKLLPNSDNGPKEFLP